ncbi:MAG: hypothetical protein QOI42_1811 [Frankiaceae bacterium]|nr:hypothetical protein [Frankiaceae bacterium]
MTARRSGAAHGAVLGQVGGSAGAGSKRPLVGAASGAVSGGEPALAVMAGEPASQATIRRTNLALVLRALATHGSRSRADLAAVTGLNKATVGNLVGELEARGLARTGLAERGGVGRPGQVVGLDGRQVFGVGVEINVDYLSVLVVDLGGAVRVDERLAMNVPALGPELVLDRMAGVIADAVATLEAGGGVIVGVSIAIPGLIDVAAGLLRFAPNIGWRDVPVADALRARLGYPGYPIRVDNDANLSAVAEFVVGDDSGIGDLLYLTGEVGVGGGVIVGGRLMRGANGFSGEFGHMPLDPAGHLCGCGRRGCWETMVGLAALLRAAATPDDMVRDPALDLGQRLAEIARRGEAGDDRTLRALDQIGAALGLGASLLVNLFDPSVLVLGGYFAFFGHYLLEPVGVALRSGVIGADAGRCRVAVSSLGFTAAARGGALVALEAVLDDPTTVAFRAEAADPRAAAAPAHSLTGQPA